MRGTTNSIQQKETLQSEFNGDEVLKCFLSNIPKGDGIIQFDEIDQTIKNIKNPVFKAFLK